MPATETLVVGAGPAGLAVAACLRERGVEPVVLERGDGVGTSWRHHYRRLHLHTVKELSGLPGLSFPAGAPRYPSRRQVIDYLDGYAAAHGIAPRFGVDVRRARPEPDGTGWLLSTSEGEWRCRRWVVAAGYNAQPVRPTWPGQTSWSGSVEHSSTYRDGEPWRGRRVLVVGAGNSGAEIALDLCEHGAATALSLRSAQHVVPRDFLGLPSQKTSVRMRRLPLPVRDAIARAVSRLAYGDLTRYGLRRPETGPITRILRDGKVPMLDVGTVERIRSGEIRVLAGIERFDEDNVVFTDGLRLPFDHVVLATGYRPGLDRWIEGLDGALDDQGRPSPGNGRLAPGLWAIGYDNDPTGLLRRIALEAPRLADSIVRDAVE
ncbi:MAG: NAD(P)/FAD-dependent oxidoreductase [Thermoanaerobaculia bacterium]